MWKAVPFAPDYEVSDSGVIRRRAPLPQHRHMRALKPKLTKSGYLEVTLKVDGEPLCIMVHRVVCRTFHGECPHDKDEVGHRDGNRANASASNLRWVTKAENYADRNAHGTHNRGANNGSAKLSDKDVSKVKQLSETLPSRKVAALLGISKSQVGNILRGEQWADCPTRRERRAMERANDR